MIYLVSKVEEKKGKNPPHNPYWAMTLIGEDSVIIENVTTFDKPGEGMKLNGEVIFKEGGKFKNFQSAQATARQDFGGRKKSEEIIQTSQQIQEDISRRVHAAQDRTAWMYAKNNASTLLAAKEGHTVGKTIQNIAADVILLATLIYNGEPTEPFSAPVQQSDKQRINDEMSVRIFDKPLTEEEQINLDDIPF